MKTTMRPARWPVVFTGLITGIGAQWVVLGWLTEGRVSGMALVLTVFWSLLLVNTTRTYKRERRALLTHQTASPTEEEPSP
ncbi:MULTISPECIES: hypothetical protein [unclassified Nocardiopsis]|uniref:hypothetical protein n=1 Tax=unclassified Nocardiopsis TaxID=2649073 RepID=UPI001160F1E2|nr:hypothetical protein [Nocardiopsis sp. TSRI0078]